MLIKIPFAQPKRLIKIPKELVEDGYRFLLFDVELASFQKYTFK